MKNARKHQQPKADIVPLFGRDEMNLIEFPFGPITAGDTKTFEVEHPVFDRELNRIVNRRLLITGSDAFGLPKPVDDQVLMGMKALTYEAGFQSKAIHFSRFQLCRTLGWPTDGRAYKRLEEAMDRIAGTTLKFKDSWWDKGISQWTSKTFHLIEEVSLCSRDQLDRQRRANGKAIQPLCSFVWSDVIWKSFQDGFIKKLDLNMWRKISTGRRREVPLRLYRILDKRFHHKNHYDFNVRQLCVGTLGISPNYAPSQMARVLRRASEWLVECGFLREVRFEDGRNGLVATFIKATGRKGTFVKQTRTAESNSPSAVIAAYLELSLEKREALWNKSLEHCRVHRKDAYAGYQRFKDKAGPAREGYRELVLTEYVRSRKKPKASAA